MAIRYNIESIKEKILIAIKTLDISNNNKNK